MKILPSGPIAIAVSRSIPEMTQVALRTHKKDMMRESPSFAKQKFLYRLSRSDYEREWGKDYTKAGLRHSSMVSAPAIMCPRLAHLRRWRSTIQRRKQRKCISRASILPWTSIAFILKQVRAGFTRSAELRSRYRKNDPGGGVFSDRRHLCKIAGAAGGGKVRSNVDQVCATIF